MDKILILTDGKAGHENQSRAFARALGCEPVMLPIQFKSTFAKSLSYLLDLFGRGLCNIPVSSLASRDENQERRHRGHSHNLFHIPDIIL